MINNYRWVWVYDCFVSVLFIIYMFVYMFMNKYMYKQEE